MPGSRNRYCSKKSSSSESSDSSSSSSDRHNRRKKCSKKKNHHRSDSESDSRKHSDIECFSNDKECKDKRNRRHSRSSSSSSSDSESEKCIEFCDIYQYFKNRLVEDKQLMVAGSSAYINVGDNNDDVTSVTYPINFGQNYLSYNMQHLSLYSPFYVRESGVYIIFIALATDSAAQFTLFVNGVFAPLTCIGTNSGAGQIIMRYMIALNKDDNVILRNYISSGTVKSQSLAGGLLNGNDATALMMKIAPLSNPCKEPKELKCLSHKKLKLFRKLTNKLVCDKELMVKGFDITGTFFTKSAQNVLVENDVKFDTYQNVNGLVWNPTSVNPEQIKITEDGVYKLFFLTNTTIPGQFAFTVNGTPVDSTIQGSNKGAGQISIRTLLELRKNDVVTIRNHTSATSAVQISEYAGGKQRSVSAILTVFKIAPICKPCVKPVDCKIEKHFECLYEKFRNYLLCKEWLQITGSPAYLSTNGSSEQKLLVNDAVNFSTNGVINNIYHQQGTTDVVIEKSGLYDIFVDLITDETAQYTVFVNGVADSSTTFGRDSGAARTLMRQFVKLNKGDVVQVRNYESNMAEIGSAVNPGGNFISINKQFMLFMLRPTCEQEHESDSESEYKCKPKNKN
jgi:hypothetical protein